MPDQKEEFKARMKRQLDDLHRRIAELEALIPHPHEHAVSYETVVSDARLRHEETMRRLHLLDAHADDWRKHGEHVTRAVHELETKVAEGEKLAP